MVGGLCTQSMYPVCSLNRINISIMYFLFLRSYVFFFIIISSLFHCLYFCMTHEIPIGAFPHHLFSRLCLSEVHSERYVGCRVGSRLATVRFTTIHFYDTCPAGPSTPDLCITVVTRASFLYLDTYMTYVGLCV